MIGNYARICDQARKLETDGNGRLWIRGVELTRAMVNNYRGSELDPDGVMGLEPNKIYRVYRSPEALEAAAKKPETELLPLGNTHDFDLPDAPAKDGRKGAAIYPTYKDGILLADVYVLDQSNIEAIKSKSLNAFSVGYDSHLELRHGFTPDGEEYDIVMTDITPNHLKLTDNPRVKTACITDDDFEEDKHNRDNDGKFSSGGGNTASGDSVIEVKGDELGDYKDIKELREKAETYYKENLAGTSVNNPNIGEIHFSKSGFDKPKSFSADERKLKVVPHLPEIIKRGDIVKEESDRKNRFNVKGWTLLSAQVKVAGKEETVFVNVRQDTNGNWYYDHVIDKKKHSDDPIRVTIPAGRSEKSAEPTNQVGGASLSDSVDDRGYEVNIFFLDKENSKTEPTKPTKPTNQTKKDVSMKLKDAIWKKLLIKKGLKDEDLKEIEKAVEKEAEVADADYFSRFQAALKVAFPDRGEEEIKSIMDAISGVISDIEAEDKGVEDANKGDAAPEVEKEIAGEDKVDTEEIKKQIMDDLRSQKEAQESVEKVFGKISVKDDSAESWYKAGCKMFGIKLKDDASCAEARIAFETAAQFKGKDGKTAKVADDGAKEAVLSDFIK
jgi:hypothetical protein